jgi:predicted ABC-type ATPase
MTEAQSNPSLYVIAGPNGAGKTTFARRFLVRYTGCNQFANADLIAQGLSPFAPEAAALRAGRVMLERMEELALRKADFAFETPLAGKGYVEWLRRRKGEGYSTHLFFLWLPTVEEALTRVEERVRAGGHNIPENDVRRRFRRGLYNFSHLYRAVVDDWMLFDNSSAAPVRIACGRQGWEEIFEAALYARVLEMGKADE